MVDMTECGDIYAAESDANMREVLKHLDTEYVLDSMDTEITMFKTQPFNVHRHPANIIKAFEAQYNECIYMYPNEKEKIYNSRTETYYYILDHLAQAYNLQINKSANPDDNYRLALIMYDILITYINNNIITLIGNYILGNTEDLYDACELKQFSKTIDSNTIALYTDNKTPYVCAYLYKVIKFMAAFDITFEDFINYLPLDAETKNFVLSNVVDAGDFYKNIICGRFDNCYYAATLVTELRVFINMNRQHSHFDIADFIKK